MKFLAFSPGKAGSLPAYLSYFFLRYPGTLGPEESWSLECFDTYDRRWRALGQVWIRREGSMTLVAPPALFPFAADPAQFGLQKPVSLGKVTVKVRPVVWGSGKEALEGQVVKVGQKGYLILKEGVSEGHRNLVAALEADGLTMLSGNEGWWVKDQAEGFNAPPIQPAADAGSPAPVFLIAHLKEGLRLARLYEKGIRDDIDTECLHQYRVHLRRVRSLASLGLVWQVIPEWTRLKNLLKLVQQRTNELRDLDVLLLDLPGLQNTLPWNQGPGLDSWKSSLVHRRNAELRRVKAWLASEDYQAIFEELGRLLEDLIRYGDPCTMAEWTQSAFARTAKSLKKTLKALGPEPPDEALHEVRIRTKKLRYVLDTLGFLGPRNTVKTLLSRLKQTQLGLGQFQDRSVLLERLKAEVAVVRAGKAAADPLVLGMLIGALAAGHAAQKEQALADARKLMSSSFRKTLDLLVSPVTPHGP